MDIITRKQAREQGLKTYFTGKPCKNGHNELRYTSTGGCTACAKHQAREWEKSAPDEYHRKQKDKANRRSHARKALRRANDPEYSHRLSVRDAAYVAQRRATNPDVYAAHLSRVRTRKAKMDTSHLSSLEQKQVIATYVLAARLSTDTGVAYHVDHRIPLKHGGKHHPNNLWVITAEENLRKGAKLLP